MKLLSAPAFANFSEYDLIKALNLIYEKPLGRNQLMNALELSEASTRSLMKKLATAKLTRITTKGISLHEKGKCFVNKLNSFLEGPVQINYGNFSVAFKISNSANMINLGLEQRDTAIRAGASGCLVFIFKNNKLTMPGVESIENVYIDIFNSLGKNFDFVEGDAVVMAFAGTKKLAEQGAWGAAKTLLLAKNI